MQWWHTMPSFCAATYHEDLIGQDTFRFVIFFFCVAVLLFFFILLFPHRDFPQTGFNEAKEVSSLPLGWSRFEAIFGL